MSPKKFRRFFIMIFELQIEPKKCNFLSLCHVPNQSMDEFDKFIENVKFNFNTFLKNTPFRLLFSVQLLCKMQYYYDKTNTEVSKIEFLASQSHPH